MRRERRQAPVQSDFLPDREKVNIPGYLNYKEKMLVLTHSLGGFHPQLIGSLLWACGEGRILL